MSKGITESTVEEIKARIDLADLISSYGIQVKTAGASKKACCPFHHEKTPSFNINENRGYYHCFGCGESGDAIKFVQKMDGLTFVEAVKKLAEQCGVKIEEKEDPAAGKRKRILALLAEITQFYRRCLQKAKEGELAREYLKKRDLGEQIQEDYLIGYAPNGVANILKWAEKYGYTPEELEAAGIIKGPTRPGDLGYHRFGGRLMFSIKDKQGRVVGFSGRQLVASKNSGKYVNSPETLVFKKSNILYGFDKAAGAVTKTPNHEVIVCEGQIDCIRLQTSGFANAVAGQGTAFTDEHVKMLKKVADQVALVYDDDGAGHKATIKSARLCLAAELPVRVVSLPGGDDPDSFLRTHPADEFRQMLDHAESIMAFQVRAERAKETNPNTVDAMNRIVREILITISQCPNAVLRAGMVGEAAKLLNLPSAALNEELGKVKIEASARRSATPPSRLPSNVSSPDEGDFDPAEDFSPEPEDGAEDPFDEGDFEGEEAAAVVPPSDLELEFCAFLHENEDSSEVGDMLGRYFNDKVFGHEFTREFVQTWRVGVVEGESYFCEWSKKWSTSPWYAKIIDLMSLGLASELAPVERMRSVYIPKLWAKYLRRRYGEMPSLASASEFDSRSFAEMNELHQDFRQLEMNEKNWSVVKPIVVKWLQK